jgi:hypothetical protein
MAAKPLAKLLMMAILVAAALAVSQIVRSLILKRSESEENRFIGTYTALSLAKERFDSNPDSLSSVYPRIFRKFGTDSTWMAEYMNRISRNVTRSEGIWGKVMAKLDSLRRSVGSDSLFRD